MARPVPAGPGRTLKAHVQVLVDDAWVNFFKKDPTRQPNFVRTVKKGFEDAMLIGIRSVKSQITMLNAVGTGFMRKSVRASVEAKPGGKPTIKAVIGTQAWYDILVHEGLGRHAPGSIQPVPARYRPTREQLDIVDAFMTYEKRKAYFKRSPKIPRPFLYSGIMAARAQMTRQINDGMKNGIRVLGSRRGIPRHNIKEVLGGKFL